jgi:uncharacterized protein (DUF2141 family)
MLTRSLGKPLAKPLAQFAALFSLSLGLSLSLAALSPAWALDLTVEVTGARSEQGHVLAAIYDSEGNWLKTPLQGERVQAGARTVLVFRNLPEGRYGITAFHDENSNGKLDANAMGMPTEAYGFSRDARGLFGPPKFADAMLELKADTTITLKIQ